ncbi:MAG: hypothetical protein HZB39_04350 [Planctomycetes bacterium]|nr:hypothetical protein [Planctomycetota bacterium]
MLERQSTQSGSPPDGGEPLVDALATYLKTSFVYPENNPRVKESIQALSERLAAASVQGAPIEFVLTRAGVRAAGREIDGARPLIAWLRERFVRARIQGVRIDPTPDPIALAAFAAGLRQCFPPGAPPLVDSWRHQGMGVEPLFATGPAAVGGPPSEPATRASSAGIPSSASPFPGGAPRAVQAPARPEPTPQAPRIALDGILALLTRSDRARTSIARMHQRVEDEYHGAAHLDTSGMLEAIVAELPETLVARPDAACREVEVVLDGLLAQLDGFLLARPDDPGTRMTHMATTMTRRRAAAMPAPLAPSTPLVPQEPVRAPASVAPLPTPQSAARPELPRAPLPPGTVVRNPFAPPQPAARPAAATPLPPNPPAPAPQTPPVAQAPPANPRNSFLDAFAMPAAHAANGTRPAPAAATPAAPAAPRARLREDSFESFLEGVRSDVVTRATAPLTPPNDARARSAGPARLEDDLEALVDDVRRLPHAADVEIAAADPVVADETLGVCLQMLAYAADGASIVAAAAQAVAPILTAPTANQRRILARWLRFAREGGPNGAQDEANQRVFEFLQQHGVAQMLSSRESLDVEQVVQTFPTQFVAFLDGLDMKDPRSEEAFAQLWEAVGGDSVADAARVLIEDGTLLTPHRTEKILKLGGRRAAAVARHYVAAGATWTRALVVNFLRRQQLPRQEAAALSIVQPLTTFPNGYLADLCDCVAHGKANFKLHGYTSLLLRQYIRDTAENPGDLDRRLYAIRALAHWPTPETIQYLEQLAKEGRLLAQTKEARAVRQAATETLKAIRESKETA